MPMLSDLCLYKLFQQIKESHTDQMSMASLKTHLKKKKSLLVASEIITLLAFVSINLDICFNTGALDHVKNNIIYLSRQCIYPLDLQIYLRHHNKKTNYVNVILHTKLICIHLPTTTR